jgi:hypothetical protein
MVLLFSDEIISLTAENGLLPKKPLYADSGLG